MEEENLSLEELEKLKEVKVKVDSGFSRVTEGICPKCNDKMIKVIENDSLFDGALTFHIIKFRCNKCKKEYMDLEQAEKYDLFLALKRISRKKSIDFVSNNLFGKILVEAT